MNEKQSCNYKALLKGVLYSIITTIFFILVITLVCYFGNISEKLLGFLLFASSGVSVFLSSLFMAKSLKRKGFLYGLFLGMGYFLIIFTASVCVSGKFSPSAQSLTTFFISVLSGALGGVIGVNN